MPEAIAAVENREIRRRYAEARRGLRAAWAWWIALLAAPWAAVLIGAAVFGMARGVWWSPGSTTFALLSWAWLAGVAPAAMVLRSHCLRATWRGRSMPSDRYLRGMLTIWWSLEVAILIGVVGSLATGVVLPCLAPAAVGWVVLAVLPPSDRAVLR